ncbi:MAG: PQQ-binding-like beta-propeller repeat protein [Planctomycetaceae bacterium]
MKLITARCVLIAASVTCCTASADDWPQWSGPDRNDIWREEGILDRFPEQGLHPVWTVKIGSGYSGPVVSEGRIYVADYIPKPETKTLEAIERLNCLDEATGEILWRHEWQTDYRSQMFSYATGPRATPVVADGAVLAMGSTGRIVCLDAVSGKLRWERDALKDFEAQVPVWGFSASPIVHKQTVIFACGGPTGLLRALDLRTGQDVWKAIPAEYEAPYSSPEIMELAGRNQLVQWTQESLNGLNPDTGEVLWQVPFTCRSNMGIGRPVRIGNDRLLTSCFYNGSMLVEVNADGATAIWKNGGDGENPNQTKSLHAVMTTPIVEGDFFYGTCSYGQLRGLDLNNGERLWEDGNITRQGRWGSFFWVRHRDRYFVNTDLGELVIMKFTPDGPQVIDRTQLIEPDTHCGFGPRRFADALVNWVHPAYANRHIIIRNDSEIRRISLAAGQ